MNFSELEQLMSSRGVTSLAEIARALSTTPQAVSNWKARNQVPHHIVANLNKISQSPADSLQSSAQPPNPQFTTHYSPLTMEEDTISLSDILLTISEQIKVIVLVPFITVFLTFTYVQFIQQPQYVSWATVLLPSAGGGGNLSGLAGVAAQLGVNVQTSGSADLSSPSLFSELLRSHIFAEKILDKKFHTEEFGKKLSLLAILTHGSDPPDFGRDTLVAIAKESLEKMLKFDQDPTSAFSVIKITASEPLFAKELAEVTLAELEDLNRFYKSQTVSEKTTFIASRIASVKNDLETSETRLKEFNERNRQISSPALQLEQGRLARDVEIQKGIYLTLKQQFELAKIEEVQKASIVQVLDKPQVPLSPSNIKLKMSVFLAGFLGIGLGIMLGFIRAYANNSDMDERKKLRHVKHVMKKKIKNIFQDRRISGIVSSLMLIGLPLFLGYESKNPVFFGMYSAKLMLLNTIYVFIFLSSSVLFIYLTRKIKV
jgi:uncharacterized protein involved in exopolysaccharide biosynthesis